MFLFHCEGESDAHAGEGCAHPPHDPGLGRRHPCTLDGSAAPGEGLDRLLQGIGRLQAPSCGEGVQDLDLHFGEHDVRGQVPVFAPEQCHQRNAPGDDEVDGGCAGDALGELLHLATRRLDAVPILDASAPGMIFDDPAACLPCVLGEKSEKQPQGRVGALLRWTRPVPESIARAVGLRVHMRPSSEVAAESAFKSPGNSLSTRPQLGPRVGSGGRASPRRIQRPSSRQWRVFRCSNRKKVRTARKLI